MSVYNTIESNDNRILDKLAMTRGVIEGLQSLSRSVAEMIKAKKSPVKAGTYEQCFNIINSLQLNLLMDRVESIENEYTVSIAHILSDYYSNPTNESANTKKYYSIISSKNIAGMCIDLLRLCYNSAAGISHVLSKRIIVGADLKSAEDSLSLICGDLEYARTINIGEYLEHGKDGRCKCGSRMNLLPETSELRCELCMRTKKVVGTVLHYESDGQQKSKHSGYDIVRHLRFWLERLQALESKVFEDDILERIRYVMRRDGIIKTDLTCIIMRKILKDPYVDATYLNDHVPLLVKTFGGEGPPIFDYDELKILTSRFIRAMNIHSEVHPTSGNKPYYPHFIYKIAEVQFKDNPEKLRILNYIHLQSADTVEKNDRYFEEICIAADNPESGLVYSPTNPSGRF